MAKTSARTASRTAKNGRITGRRARRELLKTSLLETRSNPETFVAVKGFDRSGVLRLEFLNPPSYKSLDSYQFGPENSRLIFKTGDLLDVQFDESEVCQVQCILEMDGRIQIIVSSCHTVENPLPKTSRDENGTFRDLEPCEIVPSTQLHFIRPTDINDILWNEPELPFVPRRGPNAAMPSNSGYEWKGAVLFSATGVLKQETVAQQELEGLGCMPLRKTRTLRSRTATEPEIGISNHGRKSLNGEPIPVSTSTDAALVAISTKNDRCLQDQAERTPVNTGHYLVLLHECATLTARERQRLIDELKAMNASVQDLNPPRQSNRLRRTSRRLDTTNARKSITRAQDIYAIPTSPRLTGPLEVYSEAAKELEES